MSTGFGIFTELGSRGAKLFNILHSCEDRKPRLAKERNIKVNWQGRLGQDKLVFKFSGPLCRPRFYIASTLQSISLFKVNIVHGFIRVSAGPFSC
jgi:hypothetical protein